MMKGQQTPASRTGRASRARRLVFASLVMACSSAWAETQTAIVLPVVSGDVLAPELRTNGDRIVSAFDGTRETAERWTVRLLDARGKPQIAGLLLDGHGYFLTKASEVPRLEACKVRLADGTTTQAREVRRDPARDLLLGQCTGMQHDIEGTWMSSISLRLGSWICATVDGGNDLRIGVISAKRRRIPGNGAALGVRMENAKDGRGVRIAGIASDSPAEVAGLRENDVLLAVGEEKVIGFQRVHEIISRAQPGEEIVVRFRRGQEEQTRKVRLASRSKVIANWDGEDYANGGVSIRTDNFPEVIQHDIPLSPADMGSPLLDPEGRIVGINIARVDRVTTFALPMESFWSEVRGWVQDDLHPPKALPTARGRVARPAAAE